MKLARLLWAALRQQALSIDRLALAVHPRGQVRAQVVSVAGSVERHLYFAQVVATHRTRLALVVDVAVRRGADGSADARGVGRLAPKSERAQRTKLRRGARLASLLATAPCIALSSDVADQYTALDGRGNVVYAAARLPLLGAPTLEALVPRLQARSVSTADWQVAARCPDAQQTPRSHRAGGGRRRTTRLNRAANWAARSHLPAKTSAISATLKTRS